MSSGQRPPGCRPGRLAGTGGTFTAATIPFSTHLEGQVMAAEDANTTDFPNHPRCIFTFSGLEEP
jgi:hypothetical protein